MTLASISNCAPCTTYAITKPTIKKQGLYTPLPTQKPWETVSVNYMLGLLSMKHDNYYVVVVVNRFSKMASLAPSKKSITTKATSKLFFKRMWVHFGFAVNHCFRQGQQVPLYFLVQHVVNDGYQADQINCLSTPYRWKNKGNQQDDCAYPRKVQFQASTYMG